MSDKTGKRVISETADAVPQPRTTKHTREVLLYMIAKKKNFASQGSTGRLRAVCSDALEAARPSALPATINRGDGPSDLHPP